jgi:hypothetical protein
MRAGRDPPRRPLALVIERSQIHHPAGHVGVMLAERVLPDRNRLAISFLRFQILAL